MEVRQVVTGTLAWTGLVVVVAVPSAEALLSRLMHTANAPHVQPVGSVPAMTAALAAPKPVAMPSAAAPTIRQASVTKPAGASAPISELHSGPAMEPQPMAAAASSAEAKAAAEGVAKVGPATDSAPITAMAKPAMRTEAAAPDAAVSAKAAEPAKAGAADLPPIEAGSADVRPVAMPDGEGGAIAEAVGSGLAGGLKAAPTPPPMPMAAADRPKPPPARVVTAEELDGWKSGSLADYLRQQNFANVADSAPGGQN